MSSPRRGDGFLQAGPVRVECTPVAALAFARFVMCEPPFLALRCRHTVVLEPTRTSLPVKVGKLETEVKTATVKLGQIERQIGQASRRVPRSTVAPSIPQDEDLSDSSSMSEEKQANLAKPRTEGEFAQAARSQSRCNLQVLRAQLDMLLQDLERSKAGRVDPLRERSLLQAACWQLRNERPLDGESLQDSVAALELAALEMAALTVAVDETSSPGLGLQIERILRYEVYSGSTCVCVLYSTSRVPEE